MTTGNRNELQERLFHMQTHNVAIIEGDGIGPEVVQVAVQVMQAAADRFGFELTTRHFDCGAETYLRTGSVLDDSVIDELRTFDAILLGAVGDPRVKPGILERGLVLELRTAFAQSVNIRPVKLYPGVLSPVAAATAATCNFVVLRENTEGIYTGGGMTWQEGTPHALAIQNSFTSVHATTRIVEFAFKLALARRKRLTLCHKKNVLIHSGAMWQGIVDEIGSQYPTVEHDYVHADAMCQHLVLDPGRFDVIVAPNLIGDIISDLGAVIQGGLGVAASANFNPSGTAPSMYEPVHGSAPDIAGTGRANPIATVLSAAMCLAEQLETDAALAIEAAAASVLARLGESDGQDTPGTAEIGRIIVDEIRNIHWQADDMSIMSNLAELSAKAIP